MRNIHKFVYTEKNTPHFFVKIKNKYTKKLLKSILNLYCLNKDIITVPMDNIVDCFTNGNIKLVWWSSMSKSEGIFVSKIISAKLNKEILRGVFTETGPQYANTMYIKDYNHSWYFIKTDSNSVHLYDILRSLKES